MKKIIRTQILFRHLVKEMHDVENALKNESEIKLTRNELKIFLLQATILRNLVDEEIGVVC